MKKTNYYKIGGHIVVINAPTEQLKELHMAPYEPFRIEPTEQQPLFELSIVEHVDNSQARALIVDAPLSSSGMPRVDVFEIEGGFIYDVYAPRSPRVNARIALDTTSGKAQASLEGAPFERNMSLTNALILCYISYGMEHSTLLLHASAVIYEGKAYLFLGKSGTGKSTHSRMWLSAFEGSELLNDDHPIVRIEGGKATAYGSPWSGKTPCYRNLSAPLGAIVRISRAQENHLETLSPLKSFASITTSCSGAQWSRKLMDDKVRSLEQLTQSTKCFTMHCLPNTEAAEVCHAQIKASK